jgi:hypothetical protein
MSATRGGRLLMEVQLTLIGLCGSAVSNVSAKVVADIGMESHGAVAYQYSEYPHQFKCGDVGLINRKRLVFKNVKEKSGTDLEDKQLEERKHAMLERLRKEIPLETYLEVNCPPMAL